MCGISGLISLNKDLNDSDYSTVKRMSDSISHRGPDQQKMKKFDKILLANNRLKIMDLDDRSSLPMSSQDGSVWICYNGDIWLFHFVQKLSGISRQTFNISSLALSIYCIKS